jgi:UDPglucose 6-dehydrogenase
MSEHEGQALRTVRAAIDVNESQKLLVIEKARALAGSLRDRTVAVLGLAFKPGTDDVRDAPSLKVVAELLKAGAHVRAWDPVAAGKFAGAVPGDVRYCDSAAEALRGAQICIILTEWDEVLALTPQDFEQTMQTPLVIDGRNCFVPERFVGTGVTYESIGRKPVINQTERTETS